MSTGYNNIGWKDPRLGRHIPTDFDHMDKYGLSDIQAITTKPTPVTAGVNWYSAFDAPTKGTDGRWWVARNGKLGSLRGGHAVCLPHDNSDFWTWYWYYDQGMEGACVGFAASRMMSLLNRQKYDARWLWDQAKMRDEWSDTNPGDDNGTSVRAAMDVLRDKGHKPTIPTLKGQIIQGEGIEANRWARSVDQLFDVFQNEEYRKLGAIPFHNSWGSGYPKKVWMTGEVWQRLMNEWGEFTMITDR